MALFQHSVLNKYLSGIEDFRFHDLRRTVGTNVTRFNFSRVVAGKILNHQQLAGDSHVTAIYDYSYMEEKREALQAWADHIKTIKEPSISNKIHKKHQKK